jgi:hypothetical protein
VWLEHAVGCAVDIVLCEPLAPWANDGGGNIMKHAGLPKEVQFQDASGPPGTLHLGLVPTHLMVKGAQDARDQTSSVLWVPKPDVLVWSFNGVLNYTPAEKGGVFGSISDESVEKIAKRIKLTLFNPKCACIKVDESRSFSDEDDF